MSTVAELRWPFERLGECVERLGVAAGLGPVERRGATPRPSERDRGDGARGAFIERTAHHLGLEAQPVEVQHAKLSSMLGSMAPAIVRVEDEDGDGFLALLGRRGGRLRVLDPEGRRRSVSRQQVRSAAARDLEAPLMVEVDAFLDRCGLSRAARRRAREALVRERLRSTSSGECWLLRPGPGAPFSIHLRRLAVPGYAAALVLARLAQVALLLGSWWVLGAGVLAGRLGTGSMMAWALMLLTTIPCDLLARWFQAQLSLRVGAALKRRLMAGVLRLSPDSIRHQGAGQLLGRVIESDTLETLGLSGGFFVVLGLVELSLSIAVLAAGTRPVAELLVLLACVVGLGLIGAHHFVRRRSWTHARMELTHDLVELMIGHRTRRTQQPPQRRHEGEDELLGGFRRHALGMDLGDLALRLLPRLWLLLSFVVLGSAFVSGAAAPELAVTLGGALLAQGALDHLAAATGNLLGVAIAWHQVGPIFRAGHHRPRSVELPGSFDDSRPGRALAGRGLSFQHAGRAQPVLRGVDISLEPGQRVLLEGPSGAGKSTLASILAGLRQPDQGVLLVGGLDRDALGFDAWRKHVVLVPQFHDNHLLTASLSFNLMMGSCWPPEPEALGRATELCRALGLGPLLARMPAGMAQIVGESGWHLSHGERSRVFIARALMSRPDVLVLDESLGALDAANQRRALECAAEHVGCLVVVAHP